MIVYFARSLTGQRSTGDHATYSAIKQAIRDAGCVLAMETVSGIKRADYDDMQDFIHDRDIAWINKSHCMIIESSNPSSGVGYEVAYAKWQRKIPMLIVAVKDTYLSAMYAGINRWFYRDDSDMVYGITEFLEQVEAMKQDELARFTASMWGKGAQKEGE